MLQIVMAVVRPALDHGVARAALIPTEPQAIAVYALLAWSVLLVWLGNRGSGVDDEEAEGGTSAEGKEDAPASTDPGARERGASAASRGKRVQGRQRGRKKLTRAQKRRRGHITWIQ